MVNIALMIYEKIRNKKSIDFLNRFIRSMDSINKTINASNNNISKHITMSNNIKKGFDGLTRSQKIVESFFNKVTKKI